MLALKLTYHEVSTSGRHRSNFGEVHNHRRDVVDNLSPEGGVTASQQLLGNCFEFGVAEAAWKQKAPLLQLSTPCTNEHKSPGMPAGATTFTGSCAVQFYISRKLTKARENEICRERQNEHTRSASPAQPFTISTTSSLLKNSHTPSEATTMNLLISKYGFREK